MPPTRHSSTKCADPGEALPESEGRAAELRHALVGRSHKAGLVVAEAEKFERSYDIPIVRLNPAGILGRSSTPRRSWRGQCRCSASYDPSAERRLAPRPSGLFAGRRRGRSLESRGRGCCPCRCFGRNGSERQDLRDGDAQGLRAAVVVRRRVRRARVLAVAARHGRDLCARAAALARRRAGPD